MNNSLTALTFQIISMKTRNSPNPYSEVMNGITI